MCLSCVTVCDQSTGVLGSVDKDCGGAANTPGVHFPYTHTEAIGSYREAQMETCMGSMRVIVVPDSRSVTALAGHCSGFSRLSFTPETPKGGKKYVKNKKKTTENQSYFFALGDHSHPCGTQQQLVPAEITTLCRL